MSWGVSPWIYLVWYSLGFLDLGDYLLSYFREFFNYYVLKYFFCCCLFVFMFFFVFVVVVFFFWDSWTSNVVVFNIVPEVSVEKAVAPHSSTLPGKSHGWRSLVGYSPWGCKELDTTEQLHYEL